LVSGSQAKCRSVADHSILNPHVLVPEQDGDMRYVELRRHTDNDGDRLSEQGIADAEAIGRTALHPPYTIFISTGAERATEMVRILRHAAGQGEVPITTETALRSVVEDRWREAAKAAGKGASLEEIRAVDPDLVEKECQLLGAALRAVVDGLPDQGRALVVGHSPTNEAAICGLTGQIIAPLGKGEGVLVVEDVGRYEVQPL
jgi:broad specificity phosphatase PhoE